MIIAEEYEEVELDGLNELSVEDLFYKSMMERVPMATKERFIVNPPMRVCESFSVNRASKRSSMIK